MGPGMASVGSSLNGSDTIAGIPALGPRLFPDLGVASGQGAGFVLHDLPEFDERGASVAALDPADPDIAAQQLVEDGPAADEGLVIRCDLAGEVLDDAAGLPSFGAGPLDQDVLEVDRAICPWWTISSHAKGSGNGQRFILSGESLTGDAARKRAVRSMGSDPLPEISPSAMAFLEAVLELPPVPAHLALLPVQCPRLDWKFLRCRVKAIGDQLEAIDQAIGDREAGEFGEALEEALGWFNEF